MIEGYAILYDVPSVIIPRDGVSCREVIAQDAFAESVALGYNPFTKRRIAALYNHSWQRPIPGELTLLHTPRGVKFILDAPMPNGLTGASFSFRPTTWSRRGNFFRLTRGFITEVSLVLAPRTPAYPQTKATIRCRRVRQS